MSKNNGLKKPEKEYEKPTKVERISLYQDEKTGQFYTVEEVTWKIPSGAKLIDSMECNDDSYGDVKDILYDQAHELFDPEMTGDGPTVTMFD